MFARMKLHSAVTAIILAATVFLFPKKASAQWEVRLGASGYPLAAIILLHNV